jgi:hypothetical protein
MCLCIPPVVARQRLGKSPFIVARQLLGRNAPIVARQRLGKNPPIVARQRLGKSLLIVPIFSLKLKTKFHGFGPRANYTAERPPHVGEVSANFCG